MSGSNIKEVNYRLRTALTENQELKEALQQSDGRILKLKDQNQNLAKQLQQAEDEIERSHEQIARQASSLHQQQQQVSQLEEKMQELSSVQKEYNDRSDTKVKTYQQELEIRDSVIRDLENKLQSKEDWMRQTNVNDDVLKMKVNELQQFAQNQQDEIMRLKGKLIEVSIFNTIQAEKSIDALLLSRKSEGAALLETEHLRADTMRLKNLLKCTQEFKDFAEFSEDSGDIRYLPKQPVLKSEQDDWIPQEAFQIAQDFKKRQGFELTNTAINKLLTDLNRIWRERERKQIARIRHNCNIEIMSLRRQLAARAPFDEITTNKMVSRLKQEINTVNKQLKAQSVKEKRQKKQPEAAQQLQIEIQREIARNAAKNQEYDKVFQEGARWAGTLLYTQADKLREQLSQMENEFEIIASDPLQAKRWLFDTLKRLIGSLQEKISHLQI